MTTARNLERLRRLAQPDDVEAVRRLLATAQRRGDTETLNEAALVVLGHPGEGHRYTTLLLSERFRRHLTAETLERCYRSARIAGAVRPALEALKALVGERWWPYWRSRFPNWGRSPGDPLLRALIVYLGRHGPSPVEEVQHIVRAVRAGTALSDLLATGWLQRAPEGVELGPRIARHLPLRPEHHAEDLRTFLCNRFGFFGVMRSLFEYETQMRAVARSFAPSTAPFLASVLEEVQMQSPDEVYYQGILEAFVRHYRHTYPEAWAAANDQAAA